MPSDHSSVVVCEKWRAQGRQSVKEVYQSLEGRAAQELRDSTFNGQCSMIGRGQSILRA